MRELKDAVANKKNCSWVEFPYAGHMDAYELARSEYWPALIEFFGAHGLGPSDARVQQDSLDHEIDDQVSFPDAALVTRIYIGPQAIGILGPQCSINHGPATIQEHVSAYLLSHLVFIFLLGHLSSSRLFTSSTGALC